MWQTGNQLYGRRLPGFFVGYFPANEPKVQLHRRDRTKPMRPRHFGGVIAGPVFRNRHPALGLYLNTSQSRLVHAAKGAYFYA